IIALLLLSKGQIWAQENATAYDALRVVGTQLGRGALNHIVSITGVKGHPQPEKWKIILESPRGGGVRELEVADGKIDSDQTPDRSTAGSTEGAMINVSRLNLDSSGAFAVASHTADASHTRFATADYALRTDERGEPIWVVTLLNRSSRPVGTIRLTLTPWTNHSWHVTLYVTSRGLTTSPIPHSVCTFEIQFDFINHQLLVDKSDGARRKLELKPQSVADFYRTLMRTLEDL